MNQTNYRIVMSCLLLIAGALCAAEKIPVVEEPAKAEKKPEATALLDQAVTLEFEEISLGDILRELGKKGLNYVIPAHLLEAEEPLSVKLKEVTLREAVTAIAHASNLRCRISESGIVSLAETPDATAQRKEMQHRQEANERRAEMMERLRNFRHGKEQEEGVQRRPDFRRRDDEGEGKPGEGETPDQRRRPIREKRDEEKEPRAKKEEVF